MNRPTKAEILKRAKDLTEIKKKEEQIIAEADEDFFLDRMLDLKRDQLHNTRLALKRLMKEQQLLRNIKKKWNS